MRPSRAALAGCHLMTDETRDRSAATWRGVHVTRTGEGRFEARNPRGGVVPFGSGDDPDFSPVELLFAALAGCAAVNVDAITTRRVSPTSFAVSGEGHAINDDGGNHLVGLRVSIDVAFPEGRDGDRARAILPRAVQQTHERLCTVSRTVERGEPVEYVVVEARD
jgi:putative redox protein